VTLPQWEGCTRASRTTYREAVHIVVLNWRDTANPEGGGSEVYVEHLARRWARDGHRVTLVCAAHSAAPGLEERDGIRIVRVGSKLTVYSRARALLRRGALGRVDVVVDTQNGIPFFARYVTDAPTVVLVHHIHREQWPVVYDPLRARVGWFVESVAAPRAFRGTTYVAVSEATRTELIDQGVAPDAIHVVHNGTEALRDSGCTPETAPRILVLGRLVPHKRVEHVLVAASRLRGRHPGLTVAVVGDGWWADELHEAARRHGVADIVEFTGHVSEEEKARQVDRAWVLALPSLKEGWGLVVMEAASRGVPTVAYADAGGVTESIVDGVTGLLVRGGEGDYVEALDVVLADGDRRTEMGHQARVRSTAFSWDASAAKFLGILQQAVDAASVPSGTGASGARLRATSWWRRRRRTAYRR
jgi:glycosyltransferase involved in cell wall biosynthesis